MRWRETWVTLLAGWEVLSKMLSLLELSLHFPLPEPTY